MDQLWQKEIYETLADVFEIVFLIPIEPLDGAAPPREMWASKRDYMEIRVDLQQGDDTSAFFFFPTELVKEIAGNFLGLDVGMLDQDGIDSAGKIAARMAIGGLLARIDPDAMIRVGEPQVRAIDTFTPSRLYEAPGAWVYKTGHGFLWVDLGWIGATERH
jgi:hypothetical protein